MRIAFYGNNLNQGYFFVKALNEFGVYARLFSPSYHYAQESHDWWLGVGQDKSLVHELGRRFELTNEAALSDDPGIASLYKAVSQFDLLVMMEDGPAVFSELNSVKKIFISQGADLQILPFIVRHHGGPPWSPKCLVRRLRDPEFRSYYKDHYPGWLRMQGRQRDGIRQCKISVLGPNQISLARKVGLSPSQIMHIPFVMYTGYLTELDLGEIESLNQEYKGFDRVFVHPTRQFYLKTTNDDFLKDNDKLIYGYSSYLKKTKAKSILILLEKGRSTDIEATKKLIRRLNIESNVKWLPELTNRALRSYYNINNAVICDQFNSNIGTLGNIGREVTYYGRPLITAFRKDNRLLYGTDYPRNIFSALTSKQICNAMLRLDNFSRDQFKDLERNSKEWFERNGNYRNVMPRFLSLMEEVVSQP